MPKGVEPMRDVQAIIAPKRSERANNPFCIDTDTAALLVGDGEVDELVPDELLLLEPEPVLEPVEPPAEGEGATDSVVPLLPVLAVLELDDLKIYVQIREVHREKRFIFTLQKTSRMKRLK